MKTIIKNECKCGRGQQARYKYTYDVERMKVKCVLCNKEFDYEVEE